MLNERIITLTHNIFLIIIYLCFYKLLIHKFIPPFKPKATFLFVHLSQYTSQGQRTLNQPSKAKISYINGTLQEFEAPNQGRKHPLTEPSWLHPLWLRIHILMNINSNVPHPPKQTSMPLFIATCSNPISCWPHPRQIGLSVHVHTQWRSRPHQAGGHKS